MSWNLNTPVFRYGVGKPRVWTGLGAVIVLLLLLLPFLSLPYDCFDILLLVLLWLTIATMPGLVVFVMLLVLPVPC